MIQEIESTLTELRNEIGRISPPTTASDKLLLKKLKKKYADTITLCFTNLSPIDKVYLARHKKRPNAKQYIDRLFTDFFQLSGDRLSGEDPSILGGVCLFHGVPVTVIAHQKGNTLEENIKFNFGMPSPAGYRKVQRLVKQAEKFSRPVITFIDTPGAYPGIAAEKQGQGEAIASCLALFSDITVPVIAVIVGEGGSGGALALGVANTVIMLENAVYSILSPEGFATILWKDVKRKDEASILMKLTAHDLKELNIIDYIVEEGLGSVVLNNEQVMSDLDIRLKKELSKLLRQTKETLVLGRYKKFRAMGSVDIRS